MVSVSSLQGTRLRQGKRRSPGYRPRLPGKRRGRSPTVGPPVTAACSWPRLSPGPRRRIGVRTRSRIRGFVAGNRPAAAGPDSTGPTSAPLLQLSVLVDADGQVGSEVFDGRTVLVLDPPPHQGFSVSDDVPHPVFEVFLCRVDRLRQSVRGIDGREDPLRVEVVLVWPMKMTRHWIRESGGGFAWRAASRATSRNATAARAAVMTSRTGPAVVCATFIGGAHCVIGRLDIGRGRVQAP